MQRILKYGDSQDKELNILIYQTLFCVIVDMSSTPYNLVFYVISCSK